MTPLPATYNRRWRLSPHAANLPCMKKPLYWEQEGGKENNTFAKRRCAMDCRFRVDCLMTSLEAGDQGVVRGGVLLVGRTKLTVCRRCATPSVKSTRARPRTLCPVCLCTWDCWGCGVRFYVERSQEPATDRQYCTGQCRFTTIRARLRAKKGLVDD